MKFKSFIKYSFLTLLLLLPLTVGAAQQRFCETAFDHTQRNPRGVAFSECDEGLGFPSFNAYRNAAMYGVGDVILRDDEWDFAHVQKWYRNRTVADYNNELGFKNEVSLSTGESAVAMLYVHNSGNPNRNYVNSGGSIPGNSVVARNARIKLAGFENIDGDLISNQGRRHVFNTYLSADNTTPRSIQDDFVINVETGKALRLVPLNSAGEPAGFVQYCSDGRDHDCRADRSRQFAPSNLADSDGLLLSSYHSETNARSGYFFGSQGYRQFVFFRIEVVDAPVQECRNLTVQAKHPGRTYRAGEEVGFNITDVTPESYLEDLSFRFLEGTGSVRLSDDGTMFYVTGWNSNSRLQVKVAENRPCKTVIDFEDFTTQQCDFLELFPTEPISSLNLGQTTTLGISVGPEDPFRRQIERRHAGAGSSTLSSDKRFITVRNWDRTTRVTAYVPGAGSDCEDPQYFTDALTCE